MTATRARNLAGIWQAFAAGMFADSCVHAAPFNGEHITEREARAEFIETCAESMFALAVSQADALKSYDAGRQLMQEIRSKGDNAWNPIDEDGPPNEYVGPDRQLPGKPDRRLS